MTTEPPTPALPPNLAEAYQQTAENNVLAALNPKIYFGFFSVCADGVDHGRDNTFPGLDWGQSAEALLWLGRKAEVLASWDFVKTHQREGWLVPFAIFLEMKSKTVEVNGGYPTNLIRIVHRFL